MKLTFIKPKRSFSLLTGLLLLCIGFGGALIPAPVDAIPSSLSYSDYRKQIDKESRNYCAPVTQAFYDQCLKFYGNGATNAYYLTEANANKAITPNCSPGKIIKFKSPPNQLTSCDAFAKGVTDGKSILKAHPPSGTQKPGSSQNGSGSQSGSQQADSQQKTPTAPKINECDSLKDTKNQKQCRKDFAACNKPADSKAKITSCKTAVIDAAKAKAKKDAAQAKKDDKQECTGSECEKTPTGQGKNCDDKQCDLVGLYVNPFINLLSIVVGLVVVASLIMGGIQYASSSGDPQKTSAAKKRITDTLIAFVAYAFMYAFLNFLIPGGLFGI